MALAALAGCGSLQQRDETQPPLGVAAGSSSTSYGVLYTFKGRARGARDGQHPAAALVNVGGTLYGTTGEGGARGCRHAGCGTVYAIAASGAEDVVYSFAGSKGAYPQAPVLGVNGSLYGTTLRGGTADYGTVFAIASGKETVLHSFTGKPADGADPQAAVVNAGGTLYGTTLGGGTAGYGTVFAIAASGQETVLHSFTGHLDGANPSAPLIDVKGTLYGTTSSGGTHKAGTVFSITPSGTLTVLYSFKGGSSDGYGPLGPVVDVNGTLYGTTWAGGTKNAGTVYSIAPTGSEAVVYSFKGGKADGNAPRDGLVAVRGKLYGITWVGGEYASGTIFSVTPGGKETLLHSFGEEISDGEYPDASLVYQKGTLYGTTLRGGATRYGTVFALTP